MFEPKGSKVWGCDVDSISLGQGPVAGSYEDDADLWIP